MNIIFRETCIICGKKCDVKNHIKEYHLTTKQYYDKYIKLPDEGICKTCGKQTPFRGINAGYQQLYCSNKCHGQDPEAQKLHSDLLKNKTKKEKEEIRKKQIEAWEYDNQKIKLCEDVGYKLIRIKEIDWVNDNINIKNL